MTLAHVSDVHFGRLVDSSIVDALVRDVNAQSCALVMVTGDLTQRARRREFRAARAMLEDYEAPTLVLPGNHDVHAWWHRPDLRLLNPLQRYRRMITPELMPHYERPGLAALGINTAHGRTVMGGKCAPGLAEAVEEYFTWQTDDAFKVLAVHHPLAPVEALGPLDVAKGGETVLKAAARAGVELVCCGHWHLAHSDASPLGMASRTIVVLAGTAASNRWREPQMNFNTWNAIRITETTITVEVRRYDVRQSAFVATGVHSFERRG